MGDLGQVFTQDLLAVQNFAKIVEAAGNATHLESQDSFIQTMK